MDSLVALEFLDDKHMHKWAVASIQELDEIGHCTDEQCRPLLAYLERCCEYYESRVKELNNRRDRQHLKWLREALDECMSTCDAEPKKGETMRKRFDPMHPIKIVAEAFKSLGCAVIVASHSRQCAISGYRSLFKTDLVVTYASSKIEPLLSLLSSRGWTVQKRHAPCYEASKKTWKYSMKMTIMAGTMLQMGNTLPFPVILFVKVQAKEAEWKKKPLTRKR